MKMIITEKQLSSILQHKQDVEEAASSTSNQTTGFASYGDIGSSMSAEDYPSYPDVGHWESGVTRGPANQIDTKSNWSGVVGSKISRGKANPLK
jgi:hypothetical protein